MTEQNPKRPACAAATRIAMPSHVMPLTPALTPRLCPACSEPGRTGRKRTRAEDPRALRTVSYLAPSKTTAQFSRNASAGRSREAYIAGHIVAMRQTTMAKAPVRANSSGWMRTGSLEMK